MFSNRRIRKHGLLADATVKSMVGGSSNTPGSRIYKYVLDVRPPDHEPFVAEVSLVAAYLGAKPQEYDEVRVKYDPKSLKVLFDFTGDARFETEAMNARTAQMRKETAELLASRKSGMATTTTSGAAQTLAKFGFNVAPGSVLPMVIQSGGGAGSPQSPQSQVAAITGLAKLLEAGLVSPEQFEELKQGIMSDHTVSDPSTSGL